MGLSSANITDYRGPTCLSAALLYCSTKSEVPVVSLFHLRILAWVLLAKPLVGWGFLYEAPTCKNSSYRLSNGTRFGVCIFSASCTCGRKVCLYLNCGDFVLPQDMLEEAHRVVRIFVDANHKDWLF